MAGNGAPKGRGYNRRHGYHGTPTYTSWVEMRRRCRATHRENSRTYSARGVTVCPRWDRFENFLIDMGDRPDGKTLDRIDNDGNYEPGNVRWATALTQSQNSRQVWVFDTDDHRIGVREAARRLAMSPSILSRHFYTGLRPKRTLTAGEILVIRSARMAGRLLREIAADFVVSESVIHVACYGRKTDCRYIKKTSFVGVP